MRSTSVNMKNEASDGVLSYWWDGYPVGYINALREAENGVYEGLWQQ